MLEESTEAGSLTSCEVRNTSDEKMGETAYGFEAALSRTIAIAPKRFSAAEDSL